MTFYKKLQKALYNEGEGAFVLVQRDNEICCIFSPKKDIFGNYKCSGWRITEENAKKYLGCLNGYDGHTINKLAKAYNLKIIKTYSLKDLIN